MSSKIIERVLLGILLFIGAAIVIHTPVTLWLGTQMPGAELFIKAWKEVLMGVALLLLMYAAAQRNMIDTLLQDRLIQLALVYAGIHFLMIMIFQNGLHTAGAGLLIDLRYVLYFVVVYGFLRVFPVYRRPFVVTLLGGAVVVLGFALLQLFVLPKDILATIGYSKQTISPYLTVDENPDYVRINSTLRGPNPLGAYAAIVLGVVAATVVRWKLARRGWLIAGVVAAAAGLTLWASYSRSSVIGAAIAVMLILIVSATPTIRRRLGFLFVAMTIVAAGLVAAFRHTDFVANVILHDNPTTGARIDSNTGHAESLAYGIDRMIHQPLGAGVGSTGSASLMGDKPLIIENQLLFIAHEVGWIGLVLFLWLFYEILRRLWRRRRSALALGVLGGGVGLTAIGLLLPVWVDDTVSIVWWGLAAVAVAGPVTVSKPAKKKRKTA